MRELEPDQIRNGCVYTPVYMHHEWFRSVVPPDPNQRVFVVIRDLRDTLVSWYFSMRKSHELIGEPRGDEIITSYRDRLESATLEEGLCICIDERLEDFALIQRSWIRHRDDADLILRYEDIVANEFAAFESLMRFAEIDVDDAAKREAIERESFARRTGRKRGEEKADAHHRKGVAGDWKNYFTPRVTELFKERFGDVLIETGYETDVAW